MSDELATTPRRTRAMPRLRLGRRLSGGLSGITAVGVKELRGRMRGRRAFVILTVYLLLLGAFAWMVELILERQTAAAFGSSAAFASAEVGRGVFTALILLETLLVVALAPAFTAGAVSLEREKQTLDLLAATPISSVAIVLGKLVSALAYVFILIFASIPLTAIVFVFGGVAPDDVVRGYAVLVATALGLGAIGLFFSALVKRTQAATIATYFAVLAVTLGAFFVFVFWSTMSFNGLPGSGFGPLRGQPPAALNYLNPFFAELDVVCGTNDGDGGTCAVVAFVSSRSSSTVAVPPTVVDPGTGAIVDDGKGRAVGGMVDVVPFGVPRDGFWPRSAVAWLVLGFVLLLASVQLVGPTRRWRPRGPWTRREASA